MSADLDLTAAEWTRSSYSDANGGQCVEFSRTFARTHGAIPVRDSKAPHGPALIFSAESWSSFVSALMRGALAAACPRCLIDHFRMTSAGILLCYTPSSRA